MLPEPATCERLSVRRGGILFSIFFGASVTEAVSVNVLPLSIAIFTEDPSVIFWILAINPFFGLVAQPLVGLVSDRVWTRIGRRAVFLVTAAPIVAAALVCIPFIETLSMLILVVVILQFFQDVINGSDQPLLADLVAPNQRTMVLGLVKAAENVGTILVLFVGMYLIELYRQTTANVLYGLPMYVIAAICQILCVAIPALFLSEKWIQRQSRPRLSLSRYIQDFLDQPMLPRIAVAYFLRSFSRSAVVGSVALYAYYTLKLSEDEFGASWGMMPLIAITVSVPLGVVAERFAKQRVLQVAFGTLILACLAGYLINGVTGFILAALIFGVGDMLLEVSHKAFMSEYYPADLIGQLSGTVNCFYAAGRMAGLVVVGQCVKWTNPNVDWEEMTATTFVNYNVMWLVCSIAALLGIVILSTVRDMRYIAQSFGNPSEGLRVFQKIDI